MATNAIDPNVISAMNGAAASRKSESDDLRTNFMTLLIAQLKNQDPLNPMENAELTSQLAQINTLSGIEALNETLSGIAGQIEAGQALQATALIGKGVMVPGDRILVGEEGVTTPFGVELEAGAHQLKATIIDGSGQPVRHFDLGPMQAGVESFVWDGTLDNGALAPTGSYRVVVEALDVDGKAMASQALNYAVVNAVSTGNPPLLDLGGVSAQVPLQDIRQIL
ncbi:MAG: flagellar hook assembly protein FlgD [Porticoccaceae bacterium]